MAQLNAYPRAQHGLPQTTIRFQMSSSQHLSTDWLPPNLEFLQTKPVRQYPYLAIRGRSHLHFRLTRGVDRLATKLPTPST